MTDSMNSILWSLLLIHRYNQLPSYLAVSKDLSEEVTVD